MSEIMNIVCGYKVDLMVQPILILFTKDFLHCENNWLSQAAS